MNEPARLATLELAKLRITTTQVTKLPPMTLEVLAVGWSHSKSVDDWAWLADVKTDVLHLMGTASRRASTGSASS